MIPLRLGALILLAVVVQVTVFADVRVSGVAPELLVLLAVMFGYWFGPRRGPTAAFAVGLFWDVYLPTPLGLSAIVFVVVSFAAATSGAELFRDSMLQLATIAGFGTFAAVVGYALLGEVMGHAPGRSGDAASRADRRGDQCSGGAVDTSLAGLVSRTADETRRCGRRSMILEA